MKLNVVVLGGAPGGSGMASRGGAGGDGAGIGVGVASGVGALSGCLTPQLMANVVVASNTIAGAIRFTTSPLQDAAHQREV